MLASISMLMVGVVLLTAGDCAGSPNAAPATKDVKPGDAPSSRVAAAVRPVSYWEDRFLESTESDREAALPASRSADSWEHYSLSYEIDANTAMFRATGKTRYLDRALEYTGNVVEAARPSSSLASSQYQDHYRGWVSLRADLDQPGAEVPLYESYFWRYVTTMLRVMRQTPAIHNDAAYRGRYDTLVNFAEVHIFEKWHTRGANDNIYRSRIHMAAHWAMIALNLSLLTSDPKRRTRYQEVVENIDLHLPNYPSSLRGQLRPNPVEPTAYFWNDVWGSVKRPGQDVSHANAVIAYLVEAKEHGRQWTVDDMARLTALLTRVIWPGESDYRAYLDGSGTDNGWFSDGFVKLGRYDLAVQQRLDRHKVVNSQFAANMALNATILS